MVSCVIADDHALFRESVAKILDQVLKIQVIGHFDDAEQAVECAISQNADLLFMDVSMPGTDSFTAVRRALRAKRTLKVIFISGSVEDEHIRRARSVGACAFVRKGDDARSMIAIVERVLAGERDVFNLPPDGPVDVRPGEVLPEQLTNRQYELLKLFTEGMRYKEAAMILGCSAKTIETHSSNLMKRIGARNRADVVAYGMRHKVTDSRC